MKTNVVRLPQQVGQALAPAGAREKYKLHPTIAEAACLWSGLSFDVLEGCEHESPCVPDIPSRPEVAARAQALLDATSHGDLACTKHFKPGPGGEPADYPEEILEKRTIARKDLVAWIEGNFPGELPGSPAVAPAVAASAAPAVQAEDELLTMAKVLKRVGFQKATLYRKMKAGTFPRPTHTEPTNRWLSSVIDVYIADSANTGEEDI